MRELGARKKKEEGQKHGQEGLFMTDVILLPTIKAPKSPEPTMSLTPPRGMLALTLTKEQWGELCELYLKFSTSLVVKVQCMLAMSL